MDIFQWDFYVCVLRNLGICTNLKLRSAFGNPYNAQQSRNAFTVTLISFPDQSNTWE